MLNPRQLKQHFKNNAKCTRGVTQFRWSKTTPKIFYISLQILSAHVQLIGSHFCCWTINVLYLNIVILVFAFPKHQNVMLDIPVNTLNFHVSIH